MEQAPQLAPYLTVGDAAAAIDFYRRGLGAVERNRMPAEDGKRIMHAELGVNGATLFLADAFPEYEGIGAADPAAPAPPVAVMLGFATAEEVDQCFERAVAAGAKAEMAPMDAFWGDRFATFRDPFGHRWLLDAPLAG